MGEDGIYLIWSLKYWGQLAALRDARFVIDGASQQDPLIFLVYWFPEREISSLLIIQLCLAGRPFSLLPGQLQAPGRCRTSRTTGHDEPSRPGDASPRAARGCRRRTCRWSQQLPQQARHTAGGPPSVGAQRLQRSQARSQHSWRR